MTFDRLSNSSPGLHHPIFEKVDGNTCLITLLSSLNEKHWLVPIKPMYLILIYFLIPLHNNIASELASERKRQEFDVTLIIYQITK